MSGGTSSGVVALKGEKNNNETCSNHSELCWC